MLLAHEIAAVRAPFATARPLPARAYADAAIFAFEQREIFARSWRAVALANELDAPGAWVRTSIAGGTLVVQRGRDMELHAHYDACLHRGARIFDGDRGLCLQPTCSYHGFAYDTDGALVRAPFAPQHLRDAEPRCRLRRGQAAEAFGLIFANPKADAPSLQTSMGEVPPWLLRARLGNTKLAHRADWHVAANWKLCVENFQESHHFERVHPMLQARTPHAEATTWNGEGMWLGGVMPIRQRDETVSLDGRRNGRPLLAADVDARLVHDAMMFPLLLTSLQPDYLLVYRLDPRSPTDTHVTLDILVHGSFAGASADLATFWSAIGDEDRIACERQQAAMSAGIWEPLCYATCEDGVHAFDAMVAARYAEVAP